MFSFDSVSVGSRTGTNGVVDSLLNSAPENSVNSHVMKTILDTDESVYVPPIRLARISNHTPAAL